MEGSPSPSIGSDDVVLVPEAEVTDIDEISEGWGSEELSQIKTSKSLANQFKLAVRALRSSDDTHH